MDLDKNINLQSTVLLKICTAFWQRIGDVFHGEEKISNTNAVKKYHQSIHNFLLYLPPCYHTYFRRKIWPIYHELKKFVEFFKVISSEKRFQEVLLSKVCWTLRETVDVKESIKLLLDVEKLSLSQRYELASLCCLENDIASIFNRLTHDKKYFYIGLPLQANYRFNLAQFWSLYNGRRNHKNRLQKRATESGFESVFHYAFYFSVREGNKMAATYFWFKIDIQDRIPLTIKVFNDDQCIYYSYQVIDEKITFSTRGNAKFRYTGEIILFVYSEIGSKISSVLLNNSAILSYIEGFITESFIESCNPIPSFYIKYGIPLTRLSNAILHVFQYPQHSNILLNDVVLSLFKQLFKTFSFQLSKLTRDIFIDSLNVFIQFRDEDGIRLVLSKCKDIPENIICGTRNIKICEDLIADDELRLFNLLITEGVSEHYINNFLFNYELISPVWTYRGVEIDLPYRKKMISALKSILNEKET